MKYDGTLFYSLKMDERRPIIRLAFQQLIIESPATGDSFFGKYGPGWQTDSRGLSVRPYECFHDYELLLLILCDDDPKKYKLIHKGTPFYFLGLLAFEIRNYEAAVFYMNAALAEDSRKVNNDRIYLDNPAALFMQLKAANQTGVHITMILDAFVQNAIWLLPADYLKTFTKDVFVDRFVVPSLENNQAAIVAAFYAYLLEANHLCDYLIITRSYRSLEPLVLNLFKGGLIFESLLKLYYKKVDSTDYVTLGELGKKNVDFKNDFPDVNWNGYETSLDRIVEAAEGKDYKAAFRTTYKLRNTMGHKLNWEMDVFEKPENYKKLIDQEKLAIMYVIQKQVSKV